MLVIVILLVIKPDEIDHDYEQDHEHEPRGAAFITLRNPVLFPPTNMRRCGMTVQTQQTRTALILAGIFGLIGVGIGALGAHGLRPTLLERGTLIAFETGARYHMFHVLAIFAAAVWLRDAAGVTERCGVWAVRCWSVGVVLFSGSLYWLALGGPRWLGPVTPLGGVAFMIGWALVLVAGVNKERQGPQ